MIDYEAIIKPHLTVKRFIHSIEVAKSAVALAEKYGGDKEKVYTAGILHDIMKDTDGNEQLKIMKDFGIILNYIEKATPKLWHQISGAAYISGILKITDTDIVNAVRYHTSGRKNMSITEKIVFVADFISADRDYDGVENIRSAANESLEKAMVQGTAFTIGELAKGNKLIINDTIDAYNESLISVSR